MKTQFQKRLRLLNQELFVCIGIQMGKTVKSSVNIRSKTGYSVLVIGAAGFVRTHISAALKRLRFRVR
ncbi:putative UDP-glucuronate 4-epimerase [Helianthus annuus]|uniref:UDP-glucuronate 4-epimerase n=1 Tax=Helianthus annuus TaxID=4232 RepID=A0A251VER7_HELAN|nr:putative UDP-glucuronate 4-epimerase [Helianthus annuus]